MNTFSFYKNQDGVDDLVSSLAETFRTEQLSKTASVKSADIQKVGSIIASLVKHAEVLEEVEPKLVDSIDSILAYIETSIVKAAEPALDEDLPMMDDTDIEEVAPEINWADEVDDALKLKEPMKQDLGTTKSGTRIDQMIDSIVEAHSSGKNLIPAIEKLYAADNTKSITEDAVRNELTKLMMQQAIVVSRVIDGILNHSGLPMEIIKEETRKAYDRTITMLEARMENILEIAFERISKKYSYKRRNTMLQEHLQDADHSKLRDLFSK